MRIRVRAAGARNTGVVGVAGNPVGTYNPKGRDAIPAGMMRNHST